MENIEHSIATILAGESCVITYPGLSQYAEIGSGTSACGLASFNCAKIVLNQELNGLEGVDLLKEIVFVEY